LCTFADADMLIAADVREHLPPTEQRRGRIDKGGWAIEGIRRDTVHPDVRRGGLEVFTQAQGELLFGGIRGMGGRFGRWLGFGRLVLLERFGPPIPGAEFRSRLREDKAHGHGEFRRYQEEEDQTWAPEIAAA